MFTPAQNPRGLANRIFIVVTKGCRGRSPVVVPMSLSRRGETEFVGVPKKDHNGRLLE
jgi:hypothetical protein